MRALRPAADGPELAGLLCPPYDVIDDSLRRELLAGDPRNAVSIVLPEQPGADRASAEGNVPADAAGADKYELAAQLLAQRVAEGVYVVDPAPALYVYEMRTAAGHTTRGLLGAVDLRDPADGVILPHENTMAGPVADRLALMSATDADVEPIYLVYEGGGAASRLVADVDDQLPLAACTTADGITHTLWSVTDPARLREVADDLAPRRALIADGHHRYATYRELQQQRRSTLGRGPWDAGLTLLVDTTAYGPQVHAIHRVVAGLPVDRALSAAIDFGLEVIPLAGVGEAGSALDSVPLEGPFTVAVTDGTTTALVVDSGNALRDAVIAGGEPAPLAELDVTALHRGLLGRVWQVTDDESTVGYSHEAPEAVTRAQRVGGFAVLLRPTPVEAVAAVAAAGARMPRKSTSFTPKPASGLVMRRFIDQ
jgi:uncharacterized protein (DUF1015 family)